MAPTHARCVIIGAGIVGNSLAYHLARLGWRDLVLLDKGPLPSPGGSTGHASNFIFPVDHSKEITRLTQESVCQYREAGMFTQSGGIEVARTEERMQELRRRLTSAKAWGEEAYLLSPREVREKVPYLDESVILGGFYSVGVGVVEPLQFGTIMRDRAVEMGALTVLPSTEVTGIEVARGRVRAVQTTGGVIEAETVAIACGVWSPRIARMAGATIPLTPAVHQMISVGPVPRFMSTKGEIEYPIVRDMDTNMYERQHGSDLEVGSYAHRPILVEPDDIPSIEESVLSPTQLPFTQDDFDPQLEQALDLMPEILGDDRVGIRLAINGLLSLTPDGGPVLGETEVRGLWSAAASWIKEGPGIGEAVAQWMDGHSPEIDITSADIARFYGHHRTNAHIRARTSEAFNKTYGIVHPSEQWDSSRKIRLSPFYHGEEALGAAFFEAAGWERPQWYASNERLLDEYGDRVTRRPAEWDSRWWSPIISAEHLAMRDRVGMVDLTAFAIFDVSGPGALDYIQRMVVNQADVEPGKVVYTPLLTPEGGIKADLTVMRLGDEAFRVVTGGALGMVDKKWFVDHLPADGSVALHDATSAVCTLGIWGPRAKDLLQSITSTDVSQTSFPFGTCRDIEIGSLRVLASRISYVGESGWELYLPMEQGQRLWDAVWQAGEPLGVVPVGIGVYGTTARLEKGYRSYGNELEQEYTIVEAGLARPKVKAAEFIGKEAYLRQRDEEPAAICCTLTLDDPGSADGTPRFMLGREPILDPAGNTIMDRKGRPSYVTSAGAGPSVGKHLMLGYLPPEYAVEGVGLQVMYLGERYPVTVAVAGSRPLFDPDNLRMKQ